MQNIVLPITLTPLHWILAYATAIIYVLLKAQDLTDAGTYSPGVYLKKNWASTIATILGIPVLLLIASENFADVLPINNVTACLCGWQTPSALRTIMGAAAKKFLKSNEEVKENAN